MSVRDIYDLGVIDTEPTVDPSTGDVVYGARSSSAPDTGVPINNILSVGKGAFKYLAPETYADATSFIPSWSEIGSALGFETGGAAAGVGADAAALGFMDLPAFGGGVAAEGAAGLGAGIGGALGGAAAAFGPAAIAYAIFQLLASIPPTDGPVSYGQGWGDLDGGYTPVAGRQDVPADLYAKWRGDGSWYEGGDPSLVDPLVLDFGSMSRDSDVPYRMIGGAPYRNDALAVSSGRQIARGQMGLPVDYEALPVGRGYGMDASVAPVIRDQSAPVWDAPMAVPENWNLMQDRADLMIEGGGSNTEANVWSPQSIAEFRDPLPERGQQWFDTSLRTGQMYAATGPGSPDWNAVVEFDDVADYPGDHGKPGTPASLANYQWGTF